MTVLSQQTRIDMVFLFSFFILTARQMSCLKEGDPYVCGNSLTGYVLPVYITNWKNDNITINEVHCCFNFEYNNGVCKECEIGYSSRDGNPCTVCDIGRYGNKCLGKCKCHFNQRCDNKVGCTNISSIEQFTEETATKGTVSNTSPGQFYNQTDKTETTCEKESTYNNQYPYIGLPSGIIFVCLIIYIIVSNSLCFMMYKKIKKTEDTMTPVPVNLYDEIGLVHYQDVSLPQITGQQSESLAHNPVLLPNTTESDIKNDNSSDDSNNSESDSQISQYENEFDVNENESHQTEHDEREGNGIQNEHPYYPFLPPGQNHHEYEQCPALIDNADESARTSTCTEYEHYIDMNI